MKKIKNAGGGYSFWLLIKQGMRGIFRYKIQLSVIFLLSFLATLLLTATMGTDKRLSDGYRDMMDVPRFDYTYSERMSSNASVGDVANYFVPADFTPSEYNKLKQADDKSIITDYNLVFAKQYINRDVDNGVIASAPMHELWMDLAGMMAGKADQHPIFTLDQTASTVLDGWTNLIDSVNYDVLHDSFSSADVNGFVGFVQNNIANYIDVLFSDLFVNKQSGYFIDEQNLNKTMIGRYWLDHFKDSATEKLIKQYLSGAVFRFGDWFANAVGNYVNHYFGLAEQIASIYFPYDPALTGDNWKESFNEILNGTYVKNNAPKISDTSALFFLANDVGDAKHVRAMQLEELFYQFLFGAVYNLNVNKTMSLDNAKMFTTANGDARLANYFLLDTTNPAAQSDEEHMLVHGTGGDANVVEIYKKGYRGMANPIVYNKPASQFVRSAIDEDTFVGYDKLGAMLYTAPYSNFNQKIYWHSATDSSNDWMYYQHQSMIADVNGFTFSYRNEMFMFDNISQNSYRVVLLQDFRNGGSPQNTPNLHIIKGRVPVMRNQVVISPQFARKNNLHVGDILPLDKMGMMIVGIGTDSYSFMPSPDLQNPLPNVAKSAVIYVMSSIRDSLYDGADTVNFYNSVFLTGKGDDQHKQAGLASYEAMMMNNSKNLDQSYNYFASSVGGIANRSLLSVQNFDDSNFRYNWTILPYANYIFELVSYIGVAIIMAIALVACFVSVKKNIERNSSQIGILKALGVPSIKIALSYTAYGLVVLCIAVPLGWLFGVLVEWPLCELFQTFFSLNYSMILFDYRSLLIGLLVFGALTILISIMIAYLIIGHSVIDIMNSANYWKINRFVSYVKNRWFGHARFAARFRLQVTSSSMRKITLMSVIMMIASFLITASLSLPAIINNVTDSFYKGLKYKNAFDYHVPIYNAPLGKAQISSWEGVDVYDQLYNVKNGYTIVNDDGTKTNVPGYANPWDYYGSSKDFSVMPVISYEKKGNVMQPAWSTDELLSNNGGSLIGIISNWFGNNMYSGLGNGFTVGDIDGALNWAYHSQFSSEVQRDQTMQNINKAISRGVCQIIASILNKPVPPNSKTWQSCIADNVLEQVPPYVANYTRKDSRKEQFGFGWNYNLYQPNATSLNDDVKHNVVIANKSTDESLNEALSTKYESITNQGAIDTVGLDYDNPMLNVNSETLSKINVDETSLNQLNAIMNDYRVNRGAAFDPAIKNKYYQADAAHPGKGVMTIPVILNRQAESFFKTDVNDVIKSNVRADNTQLVYKTSTAPDSKDGFAPVAKEFWAYNDDDYYNTQSPATVAGYAQGRYVYLDQNGKFQSESNHHFLNPYEIQNNKFTFSYMYDQTGKIQAGAPAFVDYYRTDDGTYQPWVRPYYSYDDLKLFLPKSYIQDDLKYYQDPLQEGRYAGVDSPYFKFVDKGQIPSWLANNPAYNSINDWVEISPYSLTYDAAGGFDKSKSGLSNILNGYWNWYVAALGKSGPHNGVSNRLIKVVPVEDNTDGDFNSLNGLTINYKVVGISDTYESRTIYTSNQFANLMMNYDTGRFMEYEIHPYIEKTNDGSYLIKELDPKRDITAKDFMFKTNRAPMYWYNSKLSAQTEPYDLTSYYADTLDKKVGNYLVRNTNSDYDHFSAVAKQDLLSEKQGLLNRMTEVVLSIAFIFIFVIIICAVLLILMISNLFVGQYERFMTLMKTEGYTNRNIAGYTINIFTPFVIVSWIIGAALSWVFLNSANGYVYNTMNLAIPFGLRSIWWVLLVSFCIIMVMYSVAFLLTYVKLNNNTAATLLRDVDAEG